MTYVNLVKPHKIYENYMHYTALKLDWVNVALNKVTYNKQQWFHVLSSKFSSYKEYEIFKAKRP